MHLCLCTCRVNKTMKSSNDRLILETKNEVNTLTCTCISSSMYYSLTCVHNKATLCIQKHGFYLLGYTAEGAQTQTENIERL